MKTETETINEVIVNGVKNGMTTDEWMVALLSSIAHSLAVIADKMTEDEK